MLGSRRRPRTCQYGCCREWHPPSARKHKRVRSAKRKEHRDWQRDQQAT